MNFYYLISPAVCDPPHRVTHPEKVDELAAAFARDGWGVGRPALIGYPRCGDYVQLLSGTHRLAAALRAGLAEIPVVIWHEREVERAFGNLERWASIMAAPLVEKR